MGEVERGEEHTLRSCIEQEVMVRESVGKKGEGGGRNGEDVGRNGEGVGWNGEGQPPRPSSISRSNYCWSNLSQGMLTTGL